jgi:ATP-dependent exoDNAse (exonuclease V) alpha subunit
MTVRGCNSILVTRPKSNAEAGSGSATNGTMPGAGLEAVVVGRYTQLPLIHAWASTVHKAQGLTLDDVRIDFDAGAFAPGQAYVALSRARAIVGLSLARPLRPSDIHIDPRVTTFMAAFESNEPVLRWPR